MFHSFTFKHGTLSSPPRAPQTAKQMRIRWFQYLLPGVDIIRDTTLTSSASRFTLMSTKLCLHLLWIMSNDLSSSAVDAPWACTETHAWDPRPSSTTDVAATTIAIRVRERRTATRCTRSRLLLDMPRRLAQIHQEEAL
ncbi:hypothetical protein BS47DRAFT_1389179 [Hydnum rufescens UP504]|uniref:Uncharacterized protein n=1 Tax=Hydnum rufescens UP504 TaxID=1448309 RepID=A0A9P6B8J8_9AGAM|nr:hypothetical protein BS47DRAFT_1389179 [Hydnum rufescens UP504]